MVRLYKIKMTAQNIKTEISEVLADMANFFKNGYIFVQENPNILFVCLILAIIPATFWLWIYYRKVTMDEGHRKLMVRTFLVGMLAVLPVFAFDYLMVRYFDFNLSYFIVEHKVGSAFHFVFLGFIVIGVIEEISKAFVVKEVDYNRREFNRIIDGIEFAAAAALGFAFAENVIYFASSFEMFYVDSTAFIQIVLVRSMASMLAHTLFSGIFGYYYGKAKFCGVPTPKHRKFVWHFHFHKAAIVRYNRLKHIMQGKNLHFHKDFRNKLREEELIAEGLLIAVVLHALYDFFLGIHMSYLIIPLLIIEYSIIAHEFHVHRNLVEYSYEC